MILEMGTLTNTKCHVIKIWRKTYLKFKDVNIFFSKWLERKAYLPSLRLLMLAHNAAERYRG